MEYVFGILISNTLAREAIELLVNSTVSLTTNQFFANNHKNNGQCKEQQELDHSDSHQTIQSGTT